MVSTADARYLMREKHLNEMRRSGKTEEEIVTFIKLLELEHVFEKPLTPDNIVLRLNRYQKIRQQKKNALPRGIAFS